jgi:integrase
MVAYQTALGAAPAPIGAAKRSLPGSVSAAIACYYSSQSFKTLSGGTPAMRRAILERFREQHGDKSLAGLQRKHIVAILDAMAPFAARNWLKAIRGLMQHGVAHGLVHEDPTQNVRLKAVRSDGHHTWTEDEIAQFEAHHPVGSKARLALALGLHTAQRRGDVVRLGPQHIRDGAITVRQQKTRTPLALPIHPELRRVLDATPTGHLALLVTKTGKSYGANDFSEQFRAWCDAAGLPPACSFHGLRKAALTRLAEAGCTIHEIASISGHKSLKEIERYTKAADQARLAREAMARVTRTDRDANCQNDPRGVSKPLIELKKKAGE